MNEIVTVKRCGVCGSDHRGAQGNAWGYECPTTRQWVAYQYVAPTAPPPDEDIAPAISNEDLLAIARGTPPAPDAIKESFNSETGYCKNGAEILIGPPTTNSGEVSNSVVVAPDPHQEPRG